MGFLVWGGVGVAVALFVGGLRLDLDASLGVGAVLCVEGSLPTGDAVLWCRRRWRDIDDVHDGMVRGARKSRTAGWLRANTLGDRSLADMVCCYVSPAIAGECWSEGQIEVLRR